MKKASSWAKAYAIFGQGIFSILVLIGLGFFIGWKINPDSSLKGILAVIGAIIGLISFIMLVYKGNYFKDKGDTKDEK